MIGIILAEMTAKMVMAVLGFWAIIGILFFLGVKETNCDWCEKKIPFMGRRKSYDKLVFCCMKCLLQYKNEEADLTNKVKNKNTHTKNVNVKKDININRKNR